ncbi:MAG: hypothetical protein C4584_00575 [Armatimonadetes bacterium]|nr:MAG: hypothetical protein C4584_00575 [Armatimonadota bacterium]
MNNILLNRGLGLRFAKIWYLLRVWKKIFSMSAQSQILTSWGGVMFLSGKTVRFLMFFVFLFAVVSSAKTIAGYSLEQVIFFFLVFNLVDITVQFLYRGVYFFRPVVVSGNYDLDLLKPLPSFFRPLFGWADILDLVTLFPLWGYFLWFAFSRNLMVGEVNILLFLALFLNSIVLGFALHLLVAAVCVLTTEIDHLIMVYRDLTGMARFPTDIYQIGLQYVLTFTIPVVILITVPAKAFLGILSLQLLGVSFLVTGGFLAVSLMFWRYALRKYTSASS